MISRACRQPAERAREVTTTLLLVCCVGCVGCAGVQSALPGATLESERIAVLFWIMFWGSAVIVALVLGLTLTACLGPAHWKARLSHPRLIFAGGLALPVVVLSVLLWYGFVVLEADIEDGGRGDVFRASVVGEQWWWRVRYEHDDGTFSESANELRVPVGRRVELELSTADVIHSFWVPAYAGKLDMVPGRVNTLRFTPRSAGIERGQCAEYCGGAHALMSFYVVAMPPDEFETWLEAERGPARSAPGLPGRALFLEAGCGGCHAIRGTEADGTIGPDLTHVGSRLSLGAGLLAMSTESFEQWISHHHEIKPENRMPPFRIFTDAEVRQIAEYLASLL